MQLNRRSFLQGAGLAAGAARAQARGVSIVVDPGDPVASAAPARWAAGQLERALAAQGLRVRRFDRTGQVPAGDRTIVAAGAGAPVARRMLGALKLSGPEALALVEEDSVLLACGTDVRGLVYALLELTDRTLHGVPLDVPKPIVERPANAIRSITRCFVSDVEDKPWYNDRSMWQPYLTMLAAQRFNRFSLTLGIGYDFPRDIRDCYFHFAYPFLVSVPGYDVRVTGLADGERERNLEMLRFISDETEARGLHFQLGLWTHAYQWTNSPHANDIIEGLTPETHAAYCRDALLAVLKACPAIRGLTFRVHGESGVAEGSYSFWKTLFDGVVRSGRRIEIDMHAKGMDQEMIDVALATGMPVNVSPKYWAEHMGLPYHQAAIRDLEMPPRDRKVEGFFALSSGSRKFLRYGYGDLLAEDRRYGVLHRIWPGTQRLLLWGDPAMAAAYGRASSFCGSAGVEICEPLSFKGRKGSGVAGGRCAYSDASLAPGYDWQKYLYTYRLWGRLVYNPDAEPETWRRFLRKQFQNAAPAAETALANASRILPLITTAHGASAANNSYWPEMYVNMPIVDAARRHPYGDSPSPRRFGTVSPFDPELFSRVDDFAQELLSGERSGKYSPLDVARWLDQFAGAAAVQEGSTPESRRLAVDVAIQSGLGRFFAHKLRSAVLYAIYNRSGDRYALDEALKAYRAARGAWTELANRAKGVYVSDVTFGFDRHLRGHWLDRLPAIDEDLADMEKRLAQARPDGAATDAVRKALAPSARPSIVCRHAPAVRFVSGRPLEIVLELVKPAPVRLHYRRVNQAELWRTAEMETRANGCHAVIAANYTESRYPLQYYFEVRESPDATWLYPGLGPSLSNQPYFVVRRAS